MGLCLRRVLLPYPMLGWPLLTGISGRFQSASVATFDWHWWQVSTGINRHQWQSSTGIRSHPQRRWSTKGRAARAKLPFVCTNRPVIITIKTMPMKKAVPAGNVCIRLCTAAAARDTGLGLGSWGTGLSFLMYPASQIEACHATQIGKTRVIVTGVRKGYQRGVECGALGWAQVCRSAGGECPERGAFGHSDVSRNRC